MLTGKQRSYLKGLAHSLKPLAQLGKEGLSEAFITQLDVLLERHELIKISVLENCAEDVSEAAREITETLDAEFVQVIGNKITIYRQSRENPMLEIPGADNRRVQINKQKKAAGGVKEERKSKRGGTISKPNQNKKAKARAEEKVSLAKRNERKFLQAKITDRINNKFKSSSKDRG